MLENLGNLIWALNFKAHDISSISILDIEEVEIDKQELKRREYGAKVTNNLNTASV